VRGWLSKQPIGRAEQRKPADLPTSGRASSVVCPSLSAFRTFTLAREATAPQPLGALINALDADCERVKAAPEIGGREAFGLSYRSRVSAQRCRSASEQATRQSNVGCGARRAVPNAKLSDREGWTAAIRSGLVFIPPTPKG
jgi:hypothetical protein